MQTQLNIHSEGCGMSHTWIKGNTIQWSKLNLDYYAACTDYSCLKCKVKFKHYYHTIPNIFEAMNREGITNECPGYPNV